MLAQQLARYRLKQQRSAPDGNCQFHSLALFFNGLDHRQVRATIVESIARNSDRFAEDIKAEYSLSVADYCQRMSRLGSHGDGITLQAFTIVFQVSVWLFMPTGLTRFGDYPNTIALIRQGEHYDAAVPA